MLRDWQDWKKQTIVWFEDKFRLNCLFMDLGKTYFFDGFTLSQLSDIFYEVSVKIMVANQCFWDF